MGGYILNQPGLPPSAQDVFSIRVPTRHRRKDIQFKEMKAIYYAIQLWLDRLRGSKLTLYYDNDACIHGLEKSSIRRPAMAPLRDIAILLSSYNIHLMPIWIPIKVNLLADNLSRFRFRKIANLNPQLGYLASSPPS